MKPKISVSEIALCVYGTLFCFHNCFKLVNSIPDSADFWKMQFPKQTTVIRTTQTKILFEQETPPKEWDVVYSSTSTAIAKLISLANIGPRVKSQFQLPSLLVFWSCRKITHALYLCQQRTKNQACISLHLQADQFCKSFTIHIIS